VSGGSPCVLNLQWAWRGAPYCWDARRPRRRRDWRISIGTTWAVWCGPFHAKNADAGPFGPLPVVTDPKTNMSSVTVDPTVPFEVLLEASSPEGISTVTVSGQGTGVNCEARQNPTAQSQVRSSAPADLSFAPTRGSECRRSSG
jgi:hypothetical protein